MKDKILEYIKLNPNVGYFTLTKIFGLSIEKLHKLLNINKFYIGTEYNGSKSVSIFDNNGNCIYFEKSDSEWEKLTYNNKDALIKVEKSNGSLDKFEYDTNGKLINVKRFG